jgi:hypothetical protein
VQIEIYKVCDILALAYAHCNLPIFQGNREI